MSKDKKVGTRKGSTKPKRKTKTKAKVLKKKELSSAMRLAGTRGWVAFDIETGNITDDVGGWGHIDKLDHAYTVTYSDFDGYMLWVQGEEQALIDYMAQFERVISFNGERFDFTVLGRYGDVSVLREKSWDLLTLINKSAGHRVKLQQVAEAFKTPAAKSADGLTAVKWWKSRKFDKRMSGFEYCKGDVEILVKAVKVVQKRGKIGFQSRGEKKHASVSWE